MSKLYEELENKVNTTDTEKLTDVQKELVKAKDTGEITEEEFDRLMDVVKHRLGGFNLQNKKSTERKIIPLSVFYN